LARRLLDAHLVHPEPPAPPQPRHNDVTVVVPVYADPDRLAACLAPLTSPVIVVDDGSPDGDSIAAVAKRSGARYIRLPTNRGASAARNAGLRAASTPFVAFLDADCIPPPGFPGDLLGHLADPAIGLVAPRIVTGARHAGKIARYERVRSALDMGPEPALVRPYAQVWYVPSAAMVARREALGAGFDEALHLGEDVDLVWRLHDAGWQIRYDPRVAIKHEDRVQPVAWYRRRVAYNESVAPLLHRHPERVPVLFLSPVAAFAWGAALAGSPAPVVILTAVRAARLRDKLTGRLPDAGAWAVRAAVDTTVREAHDLGRALAGPWAPFALALLAARGPRQHARRQHGHRQHGHRQHGHRQRGRRQRGRRQHGRRQHGRRQRARRRRLAVRLAVPIATMIVRDWLTDRPALDPLSYAALRLADESSRGAGIWLGCLRARGFRALLPRRPPPPAGGDIPELAPRPAVNSGSATV
jgi:mycofactocin glycosyltransferase